MYLNFHTKIQLFINKKAISLYLFNKIAEIKHKNLHKNNLFKVDFV